MRECPDCGFPIDRYGTDHCPKCDGPAPRETMQGMLEVDVAHAGETWEHARDKIVDALDTAIYYKHCGVRIVHG